MTGGVTTWTMLLGTDSLTVSEITEAVMDDPETPADETVLVSWQFGNAAGAGTRSHGSVDRFGPHCVQ